jgi:hypothetical protein
MENENQSKPPSRLPDGRTNPEWRKWYRLTEKGKAAIARHAKTESFKNAQAKYRAKPESKALKNESVKKRRRESYPSGRKQCIECGIVYHADSALARGFRLIGKYKCLCDLCV